MSNRWETYRLGNTVRIRRVTGEKPKPAAPVVIADEPAVFDESLTKAELVAEAESRGLDSSGTKAEIAERLR